MGLQQSAASRSRMMTPQSTFGFISLKSPQLGDSSELWHLLGCLSPAYLSPRFLPRLLLSSLSSSMQLLFLPPVHLTATFLLAGGSKGLCAPLLCREPFSHPVLEWFLGITNCEEHHSWCGGGETYWNNAFKVFAWTPLHRYSEEYTHFTEPQLSPLSYRQKYWKIVSRLVSMVGCWHETGLMAVDKASKAWWGVDGNASSFRADDTAHQTAWALRQNS